MTEKELEALIASRITAADRPISMNAASERINDLAIEWEEHRDIFDGINPFFVANWKIRDISLAWKEKSTAQEPKTVRVSATINHRKIGECPNCGKSINSGDYPRYCGHCGQAVKWE